MERYVDQAKERVLYEWQEGGDIELMLSQTATNSRVNEKLARWCLSVMLIMRNWRGAYKDLLGDFPTEFQRYYLNMEGYSRKQAIELAGAGRGMGGGPGGEVGEQKAGVAGLLKKR